MAQGAWQLQRVVETAESWGLTDVLLPFLLVFAIVFAVLQKSKIIGEGRKNINVAVALVLALAVIIPHVTGTYPPKGDVVDIINRALPNVAIVIVAIVMLLIIIGVWGGEITWVNAPIAGWIAVLSFLVIIYIFGHAAGWWKPWPAWNWINNPSSLAIIVIILVFAIIIWFVTREEQAEETKVGANKFMDGVARMFGGKK